MRALVTPLSHSFLLLKFACAGLPEGWGADGGFAQLKNLELLGNVNLIGTLPSAWGRGGHFQTLAALSVSSTGLSGELPVFSNTQLS